MAILPSITTHAVALGLAALLPYAVDGRRVQIGSEQRPGGAYVEMLSLQISGLPGSLHQSLIGLKRSQSEGQGAVLSPSEAVRRLLLTSYLAAAFNPSHLSVQFSADKFASSNPNRFGRSVSMKSTTSNVTSNLPSPPSGTHMAATISTVPPKNVGASWSNKLEKAKSRLSSAGAAGFLSYLSCKMLKYVLVFSFAWYLVAAKTGLPPTLAEWGPSATAVYLTSVLFNPLKYAAAVALIPLFDRVVTKLSQKLETGKAKAQAMLLIAIIIFAVGLFGLLILAASAVTGVAIWSPSFFG